MPVVIPPGFAQITFSYLNASGIGSKPVFTFGVGRAPSAELVEGMYDFWDLQIQPITSAHYVLDKIIARSDVGLAERVVNQAGSVSGDTQPPNVATLVQKRTGLAGRANRGRMYLPGMLPDGSVDNSGTISTVQRDGIQAVMNQLRITANVEYGDLQLFHNDSSDPTTVTELLVQSQVATQRRRSRK